MIVYLSTFCVYANYQTDDRGVVSVSDSISDASEYVDEYDKIVTFKIYDNTQKLLWFGQDTIDDSGEFGASLKIRGESGTYTLIAKNRIFGERTYDIAHEFKIYTEFNDFKNSGDKAELSRFLISNGQSFGFPVKAYEKLNDDEKDRILTVCIGISDITDQNALETFVDSLEVEKAYLDTCTDSESISGYIADTYKTEGMFFATLETEFLMTNMTTDERKALVSDLIAKTGTGKFENFKFDVIKEYAETREYFKDIEILITNADNICSFSQTSLDAYDESNKDTVLQKLKDQIPNAADFASLDTLLYTVANANPQIVVDKPTTPSHSGGGGTISSIKVVEENVIKPEPETTVQPEVVSPKGFVDLENFDWAEEAIYALYDNGIVNGVSSSEFEPSKNVTREQFVTMITKALRLTGAEATEDFNDVSENDWYYRAIVAAVRAKLINGISKSTFGVGENISRQDAAVILVRVLNYSESELVSEVDTEFADKDMISAYAVESVEKLSSSGIINGRENNKFEPFENMTRAEASVMLYRFFKAIEIVK